MGAWGTAAFDNDDASDWVYELEKNGMEAIEAALTDAMLATDLGMPDDVDAIAAGEVIAAALGKPAADLREDILALATGLAGQVTPRARAPRAGGRRARAHEPRRWRTCGPRLRTKANGEAPSTT